MQTKDSVFFETFLDKRIFCYFSEPTQATDRLVIMCHGFKGSSTGPARHFVNFSRMLVEHGYSVLRFDQPNCGNSDGPFLTVSFRDWVYTITEITEKYRMKGYRIGVLGESMGASAAIVAAGQDRNRGMVSALLLWSPDPVSSFDGDPAAIYEENGQRYRGQFWLEADEADILGSMRAFDGAIHLVYGADDAVVGRDMDKVVDGVRDMRGTVLILDGEGHSNWREGTARMVFDQELERLREWIR